MKPQFINRRTQKKTINWKLKYLRIKNKKNKAGKTG